MESSIVLSIAAVVGFTVYYEMVGATYLEYISSNGIEVILLHILLSVCLLLICVQSVFIVIIRMDPGWIC